MAFAGLQAPGGHGKSSASAAVELRHDSAQSRRRSGTFSMKRREFITLVGGAVASTPFAANAQQSVLPVLGFLSPRSPDESAHLVAAFRRGLAETGAVDGQNLAV